VTGLAKSPSLAEKATALPVYSPASADA